jgi:hypothetical protein
MYMTISRVLIVGALLFTATAPARRRPTNLSC